MTIKALLFDFDGLIVDTETPEFQVWQTIYSEHGQELAPEKWGQIVGGWGRSNFDAAEHLVGLVGDGLVAEELRARHKSESDALIQHQPVLPGVVAYLDEARRLGLRLAIASSALHSWVDGHLLRLGLHDRFNIIICAEDVPPGRTKPNPDIFLKAAEELHVKASEAIVFEDSPNGVLAARAAGLFVVSVPNTLTALLKMNGADMNLLSLAQVPLGELLRQINKV
jgi:HAD superfamily hydrolase (TIGR01509 family)